MKIIIAPDSFKESLSALVVAEQIEEGFREIFPDAEYVKLPMADGGEGTVAALVAATGGRVIEAQVTGPLGEKTAAFYGVTGDGRTAVIEMAAAGGLALVPSALRNPMKTTSYYGTGELIRLALDAGLRDLLVGIGGSATNDGGAGMLQALGVRLLDGQGQEVGPGGGCLDQVARIDCSGLDSRLEPCRISVACDVDNSLTGARGASAVFGPQKGASPEMVARLDANLGHFSRLVARDLGVEVADIPGAGAAGGMGAALLAFLGAELRPGIDVVSKVVGLERLLVGAQLLITGEGRIDSQTVFGKTPVGVARMAKRQGVPVIALAGSLSADAAVVYPHGIDALFSVVPGVCSLDDALSGAAQNVRSTARNIAAVIKMVQSL